MTDQTYTPAEQAIINKHMDGAASEINVLRSAKSQAELAKAYREALLAVKGRGIPAGRAVRERFHKLGLDTGQVVFGPLGAGSIRKQAEEGEMFTDE